MNEVYVVIGCIDETFVAGVFTDEEVAKRAKEELMRSVRWADIHPQSIDKGAEQIKNGWHHYMVTMDARGLVRVSYCEFGLPWGIEDRFFKPHAHIDPNKIHLQVCVWARDEDHAISMANERRDRYTRTNTWGTTWGKLP